MHTIVSHHKSLVKTISRYRLPKGIDWLVPYKENETIRLMDVFYTIYYPEFVRKRTLIFGINPGRFGAGLTGIPFTDPIKLENVLGIQNSFAKKPELSADFIYQFINAFSDITNFYKQYYITSLCPLGFVKKGINYNYYDDKNLQSKVKPFILKNIQDQLKLVNGNTDLAYCLGEGKNYNFFKLINSEHVFFKKIIPLPHPRFIMQYKRKFLNEYIDLYIQRFSQSSI